MHLKPDFSLLADWSEQSAQNSSRTPYTAYYISAAAQLAYVGAHHGSGINHPTFRQVEKTFREFNPDVVVVEGTSGQGTQEAQQYLRRAQQEATNGFSNAPEGQYAAYLAHQRGIPFVGGELSKAQKLQQLLRSGFSAHDMIGFDMVLAVMSGARAADNPLTDQNAAERLPGWLDGFAAQYGTSRAFGYAQFRNWYQEHLGAAFSVEGAANHEFFPNGRPATTHLEKISDAFSASREPAILSTIFEQLNAAKRVMVVYGHTHHIKHDPVLTAALGVKARPMAL